MSTSRDPRSGELKRGPRRHDEILIFSLSDPRTGRPRYVAMVLDRTFEYRLEQHFAGKYPDTTAAWCDELRALGLTPVVDVLERVPGGKSYSIAGKKMSAIRERYRREGESMLGDEQRFADQQSVTSSHRMHNARVNKAHE